MISVDCRRTVNWGFRFLHVFSRQDPGAIPGISTTGAWRNGSALPWQGKGCGFEFRCLHQGKKGVHCYHPLPSLTYQV